MITPNADEADLEGIALVSSLMDNPLGQELFRLPKFTRYYLSSIVTVAILIHIGLLSPLSLYLNDRKVFKQFELWRLLSNFAYFGPINFDFIFHLFFLYRYCRSLEADSYYHKPADFYILCIFGAAFMLVLGVIFKLTFLGPAFTFMLVYVWCRKNSMVMMNFLGVIIIRAPLMPWVLFAFSMLLSGSVPINDFVGITVGHFYFFLYDVIPQIYGINMLTLPKFA